MLIVRLLFLRIFWPQNLLRWSGYQRAELWRAHRPIDRPHGSFTFHFVWWRKKAKPGRWGNESFVREWPVRVFPNSNRSTIKPTIPRKGEWYWFLLSFSFCNLDWLIDWLMGGLIESEYVLQSKHYILSLGLSFCNVIHDWLRCQFWPHHFPLLIFSFLFISGPPGNGAKRARQP